MSSFELATQVNITVFLPHSVYLRSVIFLLVFAFCGQNVLFAQCRFCVAGQFIIIISQELGLDRPVSALPISLFKGLSVSKGKSVPQKNALQEQFFFFTTENSFNALVWF